MIRHTSLLTTLALLGIIAPVCASSAMAAVSNTAPAQPTTATPAATVPQPTPDAGPSPYQLNVVYTGEEWENAAGGDRQGSIYMNNLDAQLRVDTAKAFGWTGGRFVLDGYYASQNSLGNQYIGAVDQQSPIDTAEYGGFRLYQAYYDQTLGNTDLLFGIYDLETEFSSTKPMSLFLSKDLTWNTAFDQSGTMPQNGNVGPGNYPFTPLAFRVRETINNEWSVQGAVANALADKPDTQSTNGVYYYKQTGEMGIGEVDYEPSKHTKIMAGMWGMDSKLPTNNMTNADGSPRSIYGEEGGYLGGATRLYDGGGFRGLDGFFTLGFSSPESTNTDQSLNGGLVYTGLFDARPHDKMGLSFNENAAPDSYVKANPGSNHYETSVEATYRAPVNSWATVQPDIQYIMNPGYDSTKKNDLVVGVHFEIGHLFDLGSID